MSGPDRDAEAAYANLVREITRLPMVGMTLAGRDGTWSARHWDLGVGLDVRARPCTHTRVVGDRFQTFWNDAAVPPPGSAPHHRRTVSAWGEAKQADLARTRVLVVGAGSVGLDVIVRLSASGNENPAAMDFDVVQDHNVDRQIGATKNDAKLRRPKVHVARREAMRNATARHPSVGALNMSICDRIGILEALDYDMIFCCVDRPWPRAVLNSLAHTDLIPVIDGGIAIDTFPDSTMRSATWRSHVIRPGRPCMVCNRQLDMGEVALDIEGLLDDPRYIAASGDTPTMGRQNVALLSVSVAAALLAQYVSFTVGPGGTGDPGPLQYVLSTHNLLHLELEAYEDCLYETQPLGDRRPDLTRQRSSG